MVRVQSERSALSCTRGKVLPFTAKRLTAKEEIRNVTSFCIAAPLLSLLSFVFVVSGSPASDSRSGSNRGVGTPRSKTNPKVSRS